MSVRHIGLLNCQWNCLRWSIFAVLERMFFSPEMSVVSLSIFLLFLFPWNISVRIFYPELSFPSFWFNFTYLSHCLTYCDTKTNLGKKCFGGFIGTKVFRIWSLYIIGSDGARVYSRSLSGAPITKWSFKEPITSVVAWMEFVLSTTHTMSGIVFINRKKCQEV